MSNSELVILLHGLVRTPHSMKTMEKALKKAGYQTLNCAYPSRKYTIETLAEESLTAALSSTEKTAEFEKIHFVTHSLGGILLRYYLTKHQIPNLGRVVMLSPPNQGSEIVDKLGHLRIYKWLNGIAGQQLGTTANSLPNMLGAVDYEVGIITGNKSVNLLLSRLFPGENDGKVSVARAKLEGMRDFLVMPTSHTFIMCNAKVINQCCYFLQQGYFKKTQSE